MMYFFLQTKIYFKIIYWIIHTFFTDMKYHIYARSNSVSILSILLYLPSFKPVSYPYKLQWIIIAIYFKSGRVSLLDYFNLNGILSSYYKVINNSLHGMKKGIAITNWVFNFISAAVILKKYLFHCPTMSSYEHYLLMFVFPFLDYEILEGILSDISLTWSDSLSPV